METISFVTKQIYGGLGMYTCLLYNAAVATSITSQGRALVSTMTMFFESFLADNVQFGSLEEVLTFINNVISERPNRKFNDRVILNKNIEDVNVFAKLVMNCGYRWLPNDEELDYIWSVVRNLSQDDLNRIYYKNNLYDFMDNKYVQDIIVDIVTSLKVPFKNPNKPPENIIPKLDYLLELMKEYVYYRYMIIDRIDRCDNMIKSVTLVSDTDSTIVSYDAWYRYTLNLVKDLDFPIRRIISDPIFEFERDEFGDITDERYYRPLKKLEPEYDYDFVSDELVELKHTYRPIYDIPQDNVRYTLINICSYITTALVNDYMVKFCINTNSQSESSDKKCRIYAKNEFLFRRLLMTEAKKAYASLQEIQEGNIVPSDQQLDIKGIASMAKSSMSKSTRNALKKILYEDILNTKVIDQFIIIKHIAVLEKKIMTSLLDGSREFYKPVTIKAATSYADPMRIQGIKASVVWNYLRDDSIPAINLEERNFIDIAKVKINKNTINKLAEKYPETYEKAVNLLQQKEFKNGVDSIAIPHDINIPGWLLELIDYNTIVNDNIGGFVYESVGIRRMGKKSVNYSNILQL